MTHDEPAPGGRSHGRVTPRDHPQGTTILVLGILSWAGCGLCAPFAWSMGNAALREIDRNPSAYTNRSNVQAGRILGMVFTLALLLTIAVVTVLAIIGVVAGSTSSG